MPDVLSKAQIDRLGEQLKGAIAVAADLDMGGLDLFRQSVDAISVGLDQVLRSADLRDYTKRTKSVPSIIEKLKRQQKSRLSQLQDIVGLRFVVADLKAQDKLLAKLMGVLDAAALQSRVKDRRNAPIFGYRAIHVIVSVGGQPIEIQLRSRLQHHWAQYSEVLADQLGHDLKYGNGNKQVEAFLLELADKIAQREKELVDQNIRLNETEVQTEFDRMLPSKTRKH